MRYFLMIVGVSISLLFAMGCSKSSAPEAELQHYSMENLEGVVSSSGLAVDRQVANEGGASVRVEAAAPVTVRLYETGDIDVEDALLTYRASVRTDSVEGKVYLEMWCGFAGKGEFFSRGLQSFQTGTADWAVLETPFFLKKGQNPDNIKLNLVIDGKGTAWIDDIRLVSGPLP